MGMITIKRSDCKTKSAKKLFDTLFTRTEKEKKEHQRTLDQIDKYGYDKDFVDSMELLKEKQAEHIMNTEISNLEKGTNNVKEIKED